MPWTGNESAGDDVKNRTFNAQKNGQGELASRLSQLFLIVNAVINQETQKKFRVIGTLRWFLSITMHILYGA